MPRFFEPVSAGVQVELQLQQVECIGFIQNFNLKFNYNFRVWPRPLPVGERPSVDSECSYTAAGRGRSGEKIPGAIRLLTIHWHVNIVQDFKLYEPETHARGLTPGTRGLEPRIWAAAAEPEGPGFGANPRSPVSVWVETASGKLKHGRRNPGGTSMIA